MTNSVSPSPSKRAKTPVSLPAPTMDSQTKSRIEELIQSTPIFVFMKGNKLMPQCGFSNNVVQILNSLGMSFETFDVLSDMEIRQGIKEFSEWPTIPQVYVNGEFIGGSDILIEMYNSGELKEKLEIALAS
jgi:monothiol glutaredoxin